MGPSRRREESSQPMRQDTAQPTAPAVSAPLTEIEQWDLYNFEVHASGCRACNNPLEVHRSGHQLCALGKPLAQRAGAVIFSRRRDDKTVTIPRPTEGNYVQIISLIEAIARSERHPKQRPVIDLPQSRAELPGSFPTPAPPAPTRRRRSDAILDWPEDQPPAYQSTAQAPPAPQRPTVNFEPRPAGNTRPPNSTTATPHSHGSSHSSGSHSSGSRSASRPQHAIVVRRHQARSPILGGNMFMDALFGGGCKVEVRSFRRTD